MPLSADKNVVCGQVSRSQTYWLSMRTLDLPSVSKCTDYDFVCGQESRPRTSVLFTDSLTIYENTGLNRLSVNNNDRCDPFNNLVKEDYSVNSLARPLTDVLSADWLQLETELLYLISTDEVSVRIASYQSVILSVGPRTRNSSTDNDLVRGQGSRPLTRISSADMDLVRGQPRRTGLSAERPWETLN